jgi:hypothetical protein
MILMGLIDANGCNRSHKIEKNSNQQNDEKVFRLQKVTGEARDSPQKEPPRMIHFKMEICHVRRAIGIMST